jgi:hypothetical protein
MAEAVSKVNLVGPVAACEPRAPDVCMYWHRSGSCGILAGTYFHHHLKIRALNQGGV